MSRPLCCVGRPYNIAKYRRIRRGVQEAMGVRIQLKWLVVAAMSLACHATQAGETEAWIGGIRIAVPVAPGYTDVTSTPRGKIQAELDNSPEIRLVAVQIKERGKSTIVVKTARELESATVPRSEYLAFAARVRANPTLAKVTAADLARLKGALEKEAEAHGNTIGDIVVGPQELIGQEPVIDGAYGYTTGQKMRVVINGRQRELVSLSCTQFVWAKGRALTIQLHAAQLEQRDVESARKECGAYVRQFLLAN